MNEKEFKIKIEMIKNDFNDPRKIKCHTPQEDLHLDGGVHSGGDIFVTEDGEFIDLEYQLVDFDEEELTKYIEFAESIYEKQHKHVSVYLVCPKYVKIKVKEQTIKSEADFTIKLFCSQDDPCRFILNKVKGKMSRNEILSPDDIRAVQLLPVMCDKKDRTYFRVESIKIINMIS